MDGQGGAVVAEDGACPNCGHMGAAIEPSFDLRVAAAIVPCSYAALKQFLCRHRACFPARYRWATPLHRRRRVLAASEIVAIRAAMLRGRALTAEQRERAIGAMQRYCGEQGVE